MSVKVRELPNGKYRIVIRFRWPDETVYRERPNVDAASEAAARKWGERRQRELQAAGKPKPEEARAKPVTFASFIDDRWWKVYPAKAANAPMTKREKSKHLRIHLKPFFGELPMTDETFGAEKLAAFVAALSEGTIQGMRRKAGPKYVNNILATLSVILRSAHEWGVLSELPEMPRQKAHEPAWDFYNRDESERVISFTSTPEDHALLMFALRTGARAGEQLAIEWSSIDWVNHKITFKRSSSLGEVRETTKGKKIRRVPMGSALEAALKKIRRIGVALVFTNPDGSPLTLDQLHERLWRASRRAGLRRIKWHECRHSFASQLVIAGTPLLQVQEWMGHSTITMTMRYAHLAPGGGREYIEALDTPKRTEARTGTS